MNAILDIPADAVIKDGGLTDAYKNNGITGIPADYVTVVVYKKEVQKQLVTVIYQDKSNNNAELERSKLSGTPGESLVYSTRDTIQRYVNKGCVLSSGGVATDVEFGEGPIAYYVVLEHGTQPVNPDNPDG